MNNALLKWIARVSNDHSVEISPGKLGPLVPSSPPLLLLGFLAMETIPSSSEPLMPPACLLAPVLLTQTAFVDPIMACLSTLTSTWLFSPPTLLEKARPGLVMIQAAFSLREALTLQGAWRWMPLACLKEPGLLHSFAGIESVLLSPPPSQLPLQFEEVQPFAKGEMEMSFWLSGNGRALIFFFFLFLRQRTGGHQSVDLLRQLIIWLILKCNIWEECSCSWKISVTFSISHSFRM